MGEAEALIEKQLKRLGEIEAIVADARAAVDAGAPPALTEVLELARQGDQLLERVERAKGLYASLLRKFKQEEKSRASRGAVGR